MRNYELLLVIRPNLDEAGALEVARNVGERIQNNEGSITSTNVWGRRKLAYSIDKQVEATYILLKVKTEPATLKDLEFELKLNEALLRYLIVRDHTPETTQLQEEITEETSEVETAVTETEVEGESVLETETTATAVAPEVATTDEPVSEEAPPPEPVEA